MKIRTGFVSNSSSSSFVVVAAFPKGFKATRESVRKYLNEGPSGQTDLAPIEIKKEALGFICEGLKENQPLQVPGLFVSEVDVYMFEVTTGDGDYPFTTWIDDEGQEMEDGDGLSIFRRIPANVVDTYFD
jgi:hypothetical protein